MANPLQRVVIRAFLSKRVTKPFLSEELGPDVYAWFVYYKCDSGKGTRPVVFQVSEEELYTEKQAGEYWRARGCELLHPVLRESSVQV